MTATPPDDLRYPVGRFQETPPGDAATRAGWIEDVAQTPSRVADLVAGMTPRQLATPYRPGGWTVAQVVHHMADSHVNAYVRTRWALTETGFVIKPYDQDVWAELPDARDLDVAPSLELLRGLHARWVTLLRACSDADFARPLIHPERGAMTLDSILQLYAWHGRHHAAQIAGVRK